MIAVDDGIASGNLNAADIFFLIAVILFAIGAFVAWAVQPRALWATIVAAGLAAVSLGLLLL